jgi:hypothetical protein
MESPFIFPIQDPEKDWSMSLDTEIPEDVFPLFASVFKRATTIARQIRPKIKNKKKSSTTENGFM